MFQCLECTCYCSYGRVECPFYKGNHDLLSLPEIEKRAKNKDRLSELYLAVCNITGERNCGKYRAGLARLKKLARKDPLARGILGIFCLDGDPKEQKKGFALCKDGQYHTGCHQMEAKLAWCYEQGIGTAIDRKEADRLRHSAARRGNKELLMEVADAIARSGSVQDALHLYDWAARWGLPQGQEKFLSYRREHIDKVVGVVIFAEAMEGNGGRLAQIAREFIKDSYSYDIQEAQKWYHAAAMRGGRPAWELAKLYLDGEHWPADPGLAWWYLKQAQGNAEADALRQELEAQRERHPSTPAQRAMLAVLDIEKDPQKAKEMLESSATEGSICAMETLGITWFQGTLWGEDKVKAFSYLNQAWKQPSFSCRGKSVGFGSCLTGCYLAGCYYAGHGVAVDKTRATEILEQAFQVKLRPEKKFIPRLLWRSDGSTFYAKNHQMLLQHFADQLRNLPDACKKELTYGIHLLGCCLVDIGFKSEAWEFFELAAEQRLAAAHFHLALLGEQGVQRVPRTDRFIPGKTLELSMPHEEIFRHYQAAEAGGIESARYRLGVCYLEGKGTAPDLAEGIRRIALAAESGNANALEKLGDCFAQGIGVEADIRSAATLYGKAFAARADVTQKILDCVKQEPGLDFTDPALCAKLGVCYHDGKGVARNYQAAHKWFQAAADQGNALGKRNLGRMYELGEGVSVEWNKAMELYRQAEKISPSLVKEDIDRLEKKQQEKCRNQAAAAVQREPAPTYSVPTYSAPTYSTPTYTPPSYTPSNYSPKPYESLDYNSSIRFVNRNLKTDLALSCSEEEKKNVLAKYQSNYPDIPLYETDTTYSPPEPLDDHDYLELLNDIM